MNPLLLYGFINVVVIILCTSTTVKYPMGRLNESLTLQCGANATENGFNLYKAWYGPKELTLYTDDGKINPKVPYKDNLDIDQNGNLVIIHVSNENEGVYRCINQNVDRFETTDFMVKILRKPFAEGGNAPIRIQVDTGIVVNTSTVVYSLLPLTISWVYSKIGKLGLWDVTRVKDGVFRVNSTIYLTNENELGMYTALVRNSAGSTEIVFDLHGYEPKVFAVKQITCKPPNDVTLLCSISEDINETWTYQWIHTRHGYLIRSFPKTIVYTNTSAVYIKHCGNQDAGNYTCIWSNERANVSASTTLTVFGRPIVTFKNQLYDGSYWILTVDYFSSSKVADVTWYANDAIVNDVKTFEVNVTVSCYNVLVQESGYRTEYRSKSSDLTANVNCLIGNMYGSTEVQFQIDDLKVSITDILEETTLPPAVNISEKSNSWIETGDRHIQSEIEKSWFVPLIAVSGFLLCVVIVSGFVFVFKRASHHNITVMDNSGSNVQTTNTDIVVPVSIYDEIDQNLEIFQNQIDNVATSSRAQETNMASAVYFEVESSTEDTYNDVINPYVEPAPYKKEPNIYRSLSTVHYQKEKELCIPQNKLNIKRVTL